MSAGDEIFRRIQSVARAAAAHSGTGAPTQEYLIRHTLESFLDRLTRTSHADHFVLKGGVLLAAYGARRPTKDADSNAVQDPTVAVAVGKKACELMDRGNLEVDVIKSVSSSNSGFTVDGAAQFTMIAASAYCPQHMGQPITQAPPTPLPPQQGPIIDFPIITPGAG